MASCATSLPSPKMPNLALPVSTSRRPIRLAWRLRTASAVVVDDALASRRAPLVVRGRGAGRRVVGRRIVGGRVVGQHGGDPIASTRLGCLLRWIVRRVARGSSARALDELLDATGEHLGGGRPGEQPDLLGARAGGAAQPGADPTRGSTRRAPAGRQPAARRGRPAGLCRERRAPSPGQVHGPSRAAATASEPLAAPRTRQPSRLRICMKPAHDALRLHDQDGPAAPSLTPSPPPRTRSSGAVCISTG